MDIFIEKLCYREKYPSKISALYLTKSPSVKMYLLYHLNFICKEREAKSWRLVNILV